MHTVPLTYTKHAQLRKTQRCKRNAPIEVLLRHFDNDIYVGGGVWAWSVSREYAEFLRDEGAITPDMAESIDGLVLLIAEDTGEVVTVFKGSGRPLGRYVCRRYH